MKTIIYVHPWEGSLNHAILDKTKEILTNRGEKFQVIDLHEDEFDPTFHASELKFFSKGETPNKQVINYQEMLKNSEELIFIFPIWWFSVPAVLKGFLDKVLLKNFAYTEDKRGIMTGLLTQIKFIKATLKSVGMKHVKWIHEGYVVTSKKEQKEKFLKSLESKI